MKNDEWMEQLAQPILEQLKKYESAVGEHRFNALPQVKFMIDQNQDGPIRIGDIELTQERIRELEAYIQEQIEAFHKPTTLH